MTPTVELALDTDKDFEVFDGIREEKRAGGKHGRTIMRLGPRLQMYVEAKGLGDIYSPNTTFQIGIDDRLPDLAFVSVSRIPPGGVPESKWEIAPDIAIEVISPIEICDKVNRKVKEYFEAGVRQVWPVSQKERQILIYDSPTQITVLTENDEITNDSLLPGFCCKVGEIFQE